MAACGPEIAFATPLRFRCLEGCALCCTYQVPVLAGETAFLDAYGDAVVRRETEGADLAPDVAGYLRRENGACVFLNDQKRCAIYADRPLYCRLFPLIRDSYAYRQIDANFSCPGLGTGEPFLAGWERRQCDSYDFAVQMLRAKGAYCPEEAMRAAVGELLSEGLSAGSLEFGGRLHQAVEASRSALTGCGNLEEAGQLTGIVSQVSESSEAELGPEAAQLLRQYLMLWVRRNLTLRAAHAQALASVAPENVAYHFARIVAEAALEVCDAAEDSCEATRIAEAIRRVEAPLRSRYMSARISNAAWSGRASARPQEPRNDGG